MINFPVAYNRDFRNDFPLQLPGNLSEKCQKAVLATLPLLSLCRPLRGPLSLGMGLFRSMTHIKQTIDFYSQGNTIETAFHSLHAGLATASIGLFFFNPVLCFLTSSLSDFLIHSRSFFQETKEGHFLAAAESLGLMILDLLFIASFCYGTIEITIACMLLQIGVGCYPSLRHFQKGNYLEGACQMALTAVRIRQAIPQIRLFQWTRVHGSSFEIELKQDKKGFVYLDMPDEVLHSLFEYFKEPGMREPPYFKKGMAGAHVSVILPQERKGPVDAIGKKFTFQISHLDTVTPHDYKGIKKVYFLSGLNRALDALRVRHALLPRINGHDWHFTFGLE